jgi:anti-sigma B factor antagonist
MQFKETKTGELLVSTVLDTRIAEAVAPDLKASLIRRFEQQRVIILDLTAVLFIDSSGLGALVAVLKHLGEGGDLVLCGIKGGVASMFKLTRMDKVFRIFPTAEDAVVALTR